MWYVPPVLPLGLLTAQLPYGLGYLICKHFVVEIMNRLSDHISQIILGQAVCVTSASE
jgi:hypothetical protein